MIGTSGGVDVRRCLIWFWGSGGGGADTARRLTQVLADRLPLPQIALAARADFPDLGLLESAGHPVFKVLGGSGLKRPFRTALSVFERADALSATLNSFRPDTVVVAMNFALAYPLCLMVRERGTRLVYLAHDPSPHTGDYAPTWQVLSQKMLARQANQVVALSKAAAHEIERSRSWRGARPPKVAPLASLYQARPQGARHVADGRPLRILSLGRLVAYKGFDILARSLSTLAERADWRLTIAGDGPEKDNVRRLFAHFPQVDLSYIGWREGNEFQALIDNHDVMVCAYKDSSQSGVVCEAMAAGMPVLATPVGALPEQIQGGGWIAQRADFESVRSALVQALENRQEYTTKSQLAIEAVTRARSEVDWTSLVFGDQ